MTSRQHATTRSSTTRDPKPLHAAMTVTGVLLVTGLVMWFTLGDDEMTIAGTTSSPPGARPDSTEAPPDVIASVPLARIRQLVSDRSAVIVDARPKRHYQVGHIPGAVNWPANGPDVPLPQSLQQYGRLLPVVVYCSSATCPDADTVAKRLRERGFPRVEVFHGGWQAWQDHMASHE